MTSRERVVRCLEFDRPDRVPRHLWTLPIVDWEHGAGTIEAFRSRWPDDIAHACVPVAVQEELGDPYAVGTYVDAWGCLFENLQAGVIGQVKQPILDDWSKLDSLEPPGACLQIDSEAVNAVCCENDRFILCDACPRPFERIQFLRGTENVFMDLATGSPELQELIRRVHDHFCRELEVWAQTDVDGLGFMDDWGSQNNLLIHPDMWRQRFKPLYSDYVRIAHDAGKRAFMHSDGHILDIYEDLIEIGVDAINSQLFCMDIEEIGRRFKGQITFWGEIDRQQILPHGTTDDVRAAVGRIVDHLFDPAGGVIAQFELGPGVHLDNADAVFRAWVDLTASAEVSA